MTTQETRSRRRQRSAVPALTREEAAAFFERESYRVAHMSTAEFLAHRVSGAPWPDEVDPTDIEELEMLLPLIQS